MFGFFSHPEDSPPVGMTIKKNRKAFDLTVFNMAMNKDSSVFSKSLHGDI